jgi:hypothetical protein
VKQKRRSIVSWKRSLPVSWHPLALSQPKDQQEKLLPRLFKKLNLRLRQLMKQRMKSYKEYEADSRHSSPQSTIGFALPPARPSPLFMFVASSDC